VETRTCQADCTWSGWSACEDVSGNEAPCHTGQPGACGVGQYVCEEGALVCAPATEARPERCDNLDDNCDGFVDEGFPQVLGDPPPPWAARLSILSSPEQLTPGEPGPIQLQLENVGTMGWGQGTLELRAEAAGGGPSQLRAASWLDGQRVLEVGPMNAGETAVLDFELTMDPAATGELHEILYLVRDVDGSPVRLACPSPEVNVNVSGSGTVNTGIPDAGVNTEPLPKITSGCSCRTADAPSSRFGLLGLLGLLLWLAARRRR
jgi:MYXO-CTERM domain-containing protein